MVVAEGTESFKDSKERFLVHRNMGLGQFWNWRHCSQEILLDRLWIGGISAVLCHPLLKSLGITLILHVRCHRSRTLRTRFPGIVYQDFIIDEANAETSRLNAIRETVKAIYQGQHRIFVFETVLRENSWFVVAASIAVILKSPYENVSNFLKSARAFNGICNVDLRILSHLCERLRRVGYYSRAIHIIARHQQLPADVTHMIAMLVDIFFENRSNLPSYCLNSSKFRKGGSH